MRSAQHKSAAVEPYFSLLALTARAHAHATQLNLLRAQFQALADWQGLPARAEAHGLLPLLYQHLQTAAIEIPAPIRAELLGYYMQHAHAAHVRSQVLSEILNCFQAAGIDALLLKGAALAHLVYPQPQLRPMRDIDILVRAEEVYHAYALLPQLGFTPAPGAHHGLGPDHHHLTAIKRVSEGFSVSLELHHALHLNEAGHPLRYQAYAPTAQQFRAGKLTVSTLGREQMLWHVYRHAFCMPVGYEPLRLIWVADLISLVEAWVDQLDWEFVRARYRGVWNVLPLLHSLSPWSPLVVQRLSLAVEQLPAGAGTAYLGWPRFSLAELRSHGPRYILRESCWPAGWWLRMHYGTGPSVVGYWRAWLAHQRWLAIQLGHVLLQKARQTVHR